MNSIVASLYITPALRFKLAPEARVSPFFSIGGGYALYEQSRENQGGRANEAPRNAAHGAFLYGGGVDVKFWRLVSLRGEVRDFYSGNPSYNVPVSGGQHNVAASAARVFRWR